MENQNSQNSQHQDKSENKATDKSNVDLSHLENKLYQELEDKLSTIEDEFEEKVKNKLKQNLENDSSEETTFHSENQNAESLDEVVISHKKNLINKIEPEPNFKNSYTDRLNVASQKREEALKKGSNKYIKYSSIGMEMLGAVLLGGFGGNWLDKKLEFSFPFFTITLILLGLAATFTHLVMQLNADRKAEEQSKKVQC